MESEYERLERARKNEENLRRAADAAEKTKEASQRAADAAESAARLARAREDKIQQSEANIQELTRQLRKLEDLISRDPIRFLVFSYVIGQQRAWHDNDLTAEATAARAQIEGRIRDLRRQLEQSAEQTEAKLLESKAEGILNKFSATVDMFVERISNNLNRKYLTDEVLTEQNEWAWFPELENVLLLRGGAIIEKARTNISDFAAKMHFNHLASKFAYFICYRDYKNESFFAYLDDSKNGYQEIVINNSREVEFNIYDFASLKNPSKAIMIEYLTKTITAAISKEDLMQRLDRLSLFADEMESVVGQWQQPRWLSMTQMSENWFESTITKLNLRSIYPLGRWAAGLSALLGWVIGLGFWHSLFAGGVVFLLLAGFSYLPLSFRSSGLWSPQKRFAASFVAPFMLTLLIALYRRFA